jgi:hypothetical protein
MSRRTTEGVDDILVRLSSRATLWMVGTGLLSLHASIFTLSIVGLVFWNVYDSPNDLWVDEVFARWGIVLVLHALVVAAGWTAWKLMRAEQKAIAAARTTWTTPVLTASTQPIPQANWQARAAGQQPFSPPPPRAESVAKRALVSYTAWTSEVARRTRSVVTSVSHRGPQNGKSPSAPPAGSIQSWPEGPIRIREDEQEFIARFGSQTTTAWSTPPPNHTPASGPPEPSAPSVEKDAGQTWVEAATGGWIAPRDDDALNGAKHTNGVHPRDDSASRPQSGPDSSAK